MQSEEWVEITAPTVEEATIMGAARLGVSRDQVIVEVLDAGSKGFLGLGAREARVRISARPAPAPVVRPEPVKPAVTEPRPEPAPVVKPRPEPAPVASDAAPVLRASVESPVARSEPRVPVARPRPEARPEAPAARVESAPRVRTESAPRSFAPRPAHVEAVGEGEEGGEADSLIPVDRERVGQEVLTVAESLFAMLRLQKTIEWREEERPTLWLSLRGGDAEMLVGPHARTLDEIQYLVRTLVHRQVEGDYNLVLDADGYRERRRSSLQAMARKAADRAVQSGRTVHLRPMPPNERRLVHMTLQEDSRVRTESVGVGRDRAVTIIPRGNKTVR